MWARGEDNAEDEGNEKPREFGMRGQEGEGSRGASKKEVPHANRVDRSKHAK